ncbi:MAG: DUF4290 domain-containing protein [Bacteroidota bacterium]
MEYNTKRNFLKLREYGRNVQNLIGKIADVEDEHKRNQYAQTMVELMKMINPNVKDGPEYEQKVWDDLHIISDFGLNVESPYPTPDKSILGRKPERVNYKTKNIRYKHYGKNMELFIQKAIELEDEEEREAAIIHIGKLMKTFFAVWNKDNVDDAVIIKNIQELSNGKLNISLEKVKEHNLFESKKKPDFNNRNSGGHGGNNNNNNRNRNNKRNNNQKRRRN